MTAVDRARHEQNQRRQNPDMPTSAPRRTGTWFARGTPAIQPGVVWLKRPMPNGQWPVDQRLPRDDSFSWWVRSTCGHQGGVKQWAFYEEKFADIYEQVFRDNPCHFTRCPEFMIENDRKVSRG